MAPSGRTTTTTRTTSKTRTTTTRTRQKRKTTHFKKQQQHTKSKKQEISTVLPSSCSSITSQDSSKEVNMDGSEVIDVSNSACSTPKGQKFRIPEISTCPPAPKKQRVLSNCTLRRSPLSFFAPPDLELFFFMALRDVSV
ncbi:cyclin-dependent protein kinase inhibitor SMR9-like [Abrus precatorius]|uniref:Cyclin-dependent protein kinase inhibitor SMR9-like n=1 Tax=Abrus precatorius TaxID=3816 RepID=A0A8B8K259_ABRPR|nr:cyclin-dependent protein kinase inhibitor SMR9-like [Abrus precatorius]